MQCSKETIARLFYNVSSSFQLLFLFFYITSIFLAKFFNPFFQRNEDEYIEYVASEEEEEEEEEEIDTGYCHGEYMEKDHLVADIIGGGEELSFLNTRSTSPYLGECGDETDGEELSFFPSKRSTSLDLRGTHGERDGEELSFLPTRSTSEYLGCHVDDSDAEELTSLPTRRSSTQNPGLGGDESDVEEVSFSPTRRSTSQNLGEYGSFDSDKLSFYSLPPSESEHGDNMEEHIPSTRAHVRFSCSTYTNYEEPPSPVTMDLKKSGFAMDHDNHDGRYFTKQAEYKKVDTKFTTEENFIIFPSSSLETKRFQVEEKDKEEIFGDTCTVGSTSKSSSEWRSSINNRDYANEDPFSSSSRRSCPKWESYTVFQKYDEEMLFLDRISAQKLHETESLRSAQTCPSSLSERIIHKLATRHKRSSSIAQNPYHELESAYVAQICLTWEALNWNYKYFQQLRASRRESDPGCPAYVAQQFQQFQVLLQRYVENEPYEHGRRPVVYARMRGLAPKLLQVPEYRDSDDEKRDEYLGSRITSDSFLVVMEEAIRTFMNFLKADKENHCQIFTAFFSRKRRLSVDPTFLHLLTKVNQKKKMKLNDLRRARKCIRKRKIKETNEMEILMGQIDLKVVSRVLRMTDLTEEQMHWCENKMTKVKVIDGKLQRDSSPLFFPAH